MPAPFDTMMNNMTGSAAGGMGSGPSSPSGASGQDPTMQLALSSMDGLTGSGPNPTQALESVDKALELAHQLIMKVIPQVSQWNAKLTKDLHTIARQVLVAKMDLDVEPGPAGPPPDMSSGVTGLPPGGGTLGGLGGGMGFGA